MSLIDRFFKDWKKADETSVLSLQVVFPGALELTSEACTESLRSYHPALAEGSVEIETAGEDGIAVFGVAAWADVTVKIVGFSAPMPASSIEICVAPAHYPEELKEQVRTSQSHVLLYYAGDSADPLWGYVALAVVSGSLAKFGALAVMNETARTSFPAQALIAPDAETDMLELLATLPLPILYCGFVKHEVEGEEGVWMRTYGAHTLGLCDLAHHASDHDEGQSVFDIFTNVLSYLRDSGAELGDGHTMQIGEDLFMRVREPTEPFLEGPHPLLVAEFISEAQINPPT